MNKGVLFRVPFFSQLVRTKGACIAAHQRSESAARKVVGVFVHPRGHVVARIARRAGSGSGSPGAWARIGILNYVDLIYWHNRNL